MPRVVVVASEPGLAERLARRLGRDGSGEDVMTFDFADAALVAQARDDVVVVSGAADDASSTVEKLADIVRTLVHSAPRTGGPGRRSAAPLGRETRHRLANHLAGVVTALVLLERELEPTSPTPAATLSAARGSVREILDVVNAAAALLRRPGGQ